MPNKTSTLTYRWMEEVWNNGREDAIDEMMDETAIANGLQGVDSPGPAGFKPFFHSFRQQFPQVHVEVDDVVSEADLETSRCTVTGKDANGNEVNFSGMTFLRIQNGKIVEAWNIFDFMTMYQQLGFKITSPETMTA